MQKQAATILSAELSGFQLLAESLKPEEITPMMKEVYSLVENTARLHQGKINRYTGDTFLVLFNTAKTAAKNAIDSAFELKDQLLSFTQEKKLNLPVNLKFGIATGGIMITDIGDDQKQQTIMGEAVNHATRISQFAGEGQILVDGKTYEVSKESFEFQVLEPIPLKGGSEHIAIYEPIKKKRKKLTLSTPLKKKITSEMVGRDKEFEQVEKLVLSLIGGKGSILNILGKAGIGKSRLIEELKAQIARNKVALVEGRAVSTGQNFSFHPIIHILKSWSGITEDDSPTIYLEKLSKSIKLTAPEKFDEIFPFIATMMGLALAGKPAERVAGIQGEALEKFILKNLQDLIAISASNIPLIIVLEDLHWADASSISFLESLFRMVKNNRILFINIFRPDYEHTGDYILKYLEENLPNNHLTIRIDSLTDDESVELINNLLQNTSLPKEINELIFKKTEGNPFFIEELIRSFIDDGVIELQGSEFRVTKKIKEANIPETINEVILSRIDKLDEKTKELLKTASVIGRNFFYKVLEEAADTIEELDERLHYLKDVQLINESEKKEEIEYLFKHALAQQATYESIVKNSKKGLHLKIARSIEKVFAHNLNEFNSSLAYHYEMGENFEKAQEYLIKAGDEAIKSSASADAIDFYRKALKFYMEISGENPDNIKLRNIYYKLTIAYHSRGMSNETLETLDKTLVLYGYKIPKNNVILMPGFLYSFIHLIFVIKNESFFFKRSPDKEMDVVLTLIYIRAVALSTISPKRVFIETNYFSRLVTRIDLTKSNPALSVFIGFSLFFFWTGISLKISGKIIKIGEKFLDKKSIHVYLNYRYLKKMHEYHCGIIEKDIALDYIYKIGMDKGLYWETSYILFFNGFCFGDSGERAMCDEIAGRLKSIAEQFENSQILASYYRLLAYTDIKYKELNRSSKALEESLILFRKTEHQILLSVLCANLSLINTLKGDLEKADKYLKESEKFEKTIKVAKPFYGPFLLAKVNYEFARFRASEHYNKSNNKELKKALAELIKTAGKFRGILPESLLLKYRIETYFRQFRKAYKSLQHAMILAKRNGAKVDLSRIYFELGKFLSNPKVKYTELDGRTAGYFLDKAKTLFEEMNLQWDLQEFNQFKNDMKKIQEST